MGAIKNAKLREQFYPDWICRFYVHPNVPSVYVDELKNIPKTEIILRDDSSNWTSLFWRFEAISDSDVSIMISRDTDSRFSQREVDAVTAFENSGALFHIMRDHPHHGFFVLGGMFGVKKGILDDMKDLCNNFTRTDDYGTDYRFFESLTRRIAASHVLIHDPFFAKIPFPTERKNFEFVGQVFDEFENPIPDHIEALKKFI